MIWKDLGEEYSRQTGQQRQPSEGGNKLDWLEKQKASNAEKKKKLGLRGGWPSRPQSGFGFYSPNDGKSSQAFSGRRIWSSLIFLISCNWSVVNRSLAYAECVIAW